MIGRVVGTLGLVAVLVGRSQAASVDLIAYSVSNGNGSDIYVMGADGSNPVNLTNSSGRNGYPAWSTDGTKIAFCSTRGSDYYHIFVMDADGSNQTQLTYYPADDRHPTWSPDGSKIAFASRRDGNYEIYVMGADGSRQTNITNNPAYDGDPSWSPDGTRIAFSSDRDGQPARVGKTYDIYVIGVDGSSPVRVTFNNCLSPSWSPDGTKIAYTPSSGAHGVVIMNADGTNQETLVRGLLVISVSWSPDGQRLALSVSAADPSKQNDIYIVNVDGSGLVQLTNTADYGWYLSWSPVRPTAVAPTRWGQLKWGFR